ncbi:hypothetical protein [Clostridium sporogenes]|nr:hypothetical protein [Clostridium sporogenes]
MEVISGYIKFGKQISIFDEYMNNEKETNKSLKKNQDKEMETEK